MTGYNRLGVLPAQDFAIVEQSIAGILGFRVIGSLPVECC
jgi:hypothetical protein